MERFKFPKGFPTYQNLYQPAEGELELTPEEIEALPQPINVMLIIDDLTISRRLRLELAGGGMRPFLPEEEKPFDEQIEEKKPDIVVVSENIPVDLNKHPERGIVVLLDHKNDTSEKRTGYLRAGADHAASLDTLSPTGADVFASYIRAIHRRYCEGLRRPKEKPSVEVLFDDSKKTIVVSGKQVELSPSELGLVEVFYKNFGRVMKNDEIILKSFGEHWMGDEEYLRVFIASLRRALRNAELADILPIVNSPGIGYMLDIESKAK